MIQARLTVLLVLLATLPARAQDPPCTGDLAAHLRRGHEARQARADEDALRAFRCAYALAPTADTLAQIGLAEAALGRWVAAEKDLAAALAQTEDPDIRRNRAIFEKNMATIRANLGDLEVLGPQGALLRVGGIDRGRLPLPGPLRLPTGSIAVEVLPPGPQRRPTLRQVTIRAGGLTRETIDAPLVVALAPATRPQAAPGRGRLLGWLAVGGAGLLLAGGVAAQATREALVAQYNDESCLDDLGNTREQSCGHKLGGVGVAQGLAIAGFVTAAGLSAAALGLLIPAYRRERRLGLSVGAGALWLHGSFD